MVSSRRRKVRRCLLGVTLKATRIWWIGQVTVRVMAVVRSKSTRPVREKADHGAEKSCLPRRKRRGLRGGKRRALRCAPQNPPATASKSQSSRRVNHTGRKFIWAVKASNVLRKDCEKLNKYPRGPLPEGSDRQRLRLKMKLFCRAKWERLHRQAEASGIPPVASFHKSFWDYLLIETNRAPPGAQMWVDSWDALLAGLPRAREPSPVRPVNAYPPPVEEPSRRRPRGRGSFSPNPNRACRMCGYLGPGPHAWNSCRLPPGRRNGGPSRQRGSGTFRRRCGCLRGAKCPH